ncbi:aspartate 1-decarboxylase [Candidatus Desantisbacteria bacterium CG1_02_38_46]|uniref:Aspartate 1-decarboxylase n=2 Tax=unclassified Candidatus Desantisiibacteriota TaxID=3106372 RepID=A0A2H9PBZ7_9BACT|nr:MAG: aspartate 1-decarboxylase [Candidatus Desantisbacteria bacterium CG1_02_38_46]PIZ16545.1 MAG: aspartate 1-decarboxylase [Candidatus Desantisbacteria bacterium CG_4_10_14_0_8_um_filter_39_17]
MLRIMLKSKIHRARITAAELEYEGSITIDSLLMREADILPGEQVWVLNMRNGERFITYVIKGSEDSGEICLNGPAAHLGKVGDEVLILSFVSVDEKDIKNYKLKIVLVDKKNKIVLGPARS